jgi:hypothetical protein
MTSPRLDGPFAATRRYGTGPLALGFDILTLPLQISNTLTGSPPLEIPVFGQVAPGPTLAPPAPAPGPTPAPAPTPAPVGRVSSYPTPTPTDPVAAYKQGDYSLGTTPEGRQAIIKFLADYWEDSGMDHDQAVAVATSNFDTNLRNYLEVEALLAAGWTIGPSGWIPPP